MLHVISINQNIKSEILEIDEYIPVKIRWGELNYWGKNILNWRIGDLKKSLLEIAIDTCTGLIDHVTVIGFDRVVFKNEMQDLMVSDTQCGVPVIELKSETGYQSIDDKGMFEIYLSRNKIDLVMSHNPIIKRIISGRVFFDLDNNSDICVISVSQLTEKEYLQIKDTLEFMGGNK